MKVQRLNYRTTAAVLIMYVHNNRLQEKMNDISTLCRITRKIAEGHDVKENWDFFIVRGK